tara:strand:- start:202 stop:318 length:117 start_codon:yes stop_codon:yes gene_type:complete
MMSVGYGLGMFAVGMAVILIGGLIIYKIINKREEENDD